MSVSVPPRARRHSRAERWVRRTARTLSVLALVSGTLAYVAVGVLNKFDLVDQPTYQPLFAVCLTVFLVSLGGRLLWGLVVLIRKAVLRGPRRRTLRALAAQIRWRWLARRRSVPAETLAKLLLIDPVIWREKNDPKPRYTELLSGTYSGQPALSVHIERGSRLLPQVDQIVALELPGILPELQIIDRADDPYGLAPQQQFESARFNESWRVDADNERYASAFTHPRMMRLLNGLDPSIGSIHVRGAWLVSTAPVAFTPQLLQVHLDALERIGQAVPDWVWDEFGHRYTGPRQAGRSPQP